MKYFIFIIVWVSAVSCQPRQEEVTPDAFYYESIEVDGIAANQLGFTRVSASPAIRLAFSVPVDRESVAKSVKLTEKAGSQSIPLTFGFVRNDTTIVIIPQNNLSELTNYTLNVETSLLSRQKKALNNSISVNFVTGIDTTDKFPVLSDSALLDLVQKQTFRYFWDFAHPVSGLARERNSSGDVVTSGGSGFGVMAILVAVNRRFITRQEGLTRLLKMTDFLKNKARTYHGAFPHWLNGATGETVPFSQKDDGADLVETSYLMQGLLAARQYFNGQQADEITLRKTINDLWNAVEWNWFTKNGAETNLYWHWSPTYHWAMNLPIRGWNEALITYVLAASSNQYAISKTVYDTSWAQNGTMKNGNRYYDTRLPLGPANGGPLFFSQYSFLGLDPRGLSDAYANYWEQNTAHSRINYAYCLANPGKFSGYGANCWGLTASDDPNGYAAHEPNNDNGTISPTAALSAFPYTPTESMRALRFFYDKLGHRIWRNYGFVDAFNLSTIWFADSFLAIDQGPIIVMIENHRSQLLWKLVMSAPEVKQGLKKLAFQSPTL
ncbi:glucoamylase family protein [Larkinella bovis]|uniref:Glucoamylase family protein n=1 Tax=Larkinella bovis TaxID=683041 RepID=A0ABW0IAN1_9BACT